MPDSLELVRKFYPDVEKVRDATADVAIEVTEADAKAKGVRNHKACAMAVACKRKLHLDGVVISRSVAYLIKDDVATRYRVPPSVAREVIVFDRGGAFAPGEYELCKPGRTHQIHHKGTRGHTGRKPGSRPRGKPNHVTANVRTSILGAA